MNNVKVTKQFVEYSKELAEDIIGYNRCFHYGNMDNGKLDLAFGGKATSMIVDQVGEDATRKEAAKMHNQAVDNYKRVLDNKVKKGL